jgi:hypothetical protein
VKIQTGYNNRYTAGNHWQASPVDLIVITKTGLDDGFRLRFLVDIAICRNKGRYFPYFVKRVASISQPSYSDQ